MRRRSSLTITLVLITSPLVLAGCGRDDDRDRYGGHGGGFHFSGGGGSFRGGGGGGSVGHVSPGGGFGGFGHFGGGG